MRPLPGDDAFTASSRPASFDNDATPVVARGHPPQMTYFITDEKSIGEPQPSVPLQPKPQDPQNSTYGVKSLESTISSLSQDMDDQDSRRSAWRDRKNNSRQGIPKQTEDDVAYAPSTDVSGTTSPFQHRRNSQTTISRPFTPLSFGSPAPPSLVSSPVSRRHSDAGLSDNDVASQAILSSGEEERDMGSEMMDSGSAPQLVMPSIKMPSRRPFTERGKNIGRLKILIAGDSGVGKTSLIKAIVQTCEDIVHVDPLTTPPMAIPERRRSSKSKSRSESTGSISTAEITEVYASTKAYPSWWSDLEESRVLRRRKSLGDSVLERNLCFVDTPGYGNKTSCLESIVPVVDYIESHFKRAMSIQSMSDIDMISMMSGNGGSQVDLVFYVFTQRVKAVDMEYLRRLSRLTNVIPLISRSDLNSAEELSSLKENIISAFQTSCLRPFNFQQAPDVTNPEAPYAISTAASKDHDTMDASLLMSPDYVQPLLESELPYLVSQIFERDTISWLRHSAAKKFIQWRDASPLPDKPQDLYRPLSQPRLASPALKGMVGATTSYAVARVTDHTQREERLAQVRLANWAADLQRSLANERARYEQLARSERAVWLTERLGECVQDGTIVPLSQARQSTTTVSALDDAFKLHDMYTRRRRGTAGVEAHDPLGLIQLNAELKRRSWTALQVVSSLGVLGGLAFYITRSWHTESETVGVWEWVLHAL